jgi:hypothetical protein
MIATKITAEAPSSFSKVSQEHREFSPGKIGRSFGPPSDTPRRDQPNFNPF